MSSHEIARLAEVAIWAQGQDQHDVLVDRAKDQDEAAEIDDDLGHRAATE